MMAGVETGNGSMYPDHALLEWLVIRKLGFDTIYLYAKFDDPSFSRSRDIIEASKCHVTPMTPLLRVICLTYAWT